MRTFAQRSQSSQQATEAGFKAPARSYLGQSREVNSFRHLTTSGHPLEPELRALMESRFAHDFSRVRVHSDEKAAESARSMGALAYTVGDNIVFGSSKYQPASMEGRTLLAHELTHVVQQRGRPVDPNQVEPSNSDAEREARSVAASVVRGERAPNVQAAPVGLARDVGFAGRGPISDPYGMGYNEIYRRAGAASLAAVQDLASCEGPGMTFNQATFEALPTARRTAVLALRPHATGTACATWFQTLARTTSGGEFRLDTYSPHESAAGDVDKYVGTEIKLTFTPSVNTITDKIGFVQILRPIGLLPNEVPRATQASDGQAGWALDRMQGRRSPIYGQNNNATAGGNTHFGYRRNATDMDPAWMYDKTNEQRGRGQSLSFEGTTYALDATHSVYLGGLHWGFNVSAAGTVATTPVTIQSLTAPEGIQRRALELWNAQASNPNPAQRNDPNQDQVPVP